MKTELEPTAVFQALCSINQVEEYLYISNGVYYLHFIGLNELFHGLNFLRKNSKNRDVSYIGASSQAPIDFKLNAVPADSTNLHTTPLI